MRDVPEISDMVPKFEQTPNLVKIHVSLMYLLSKVADLQIVWKQYAGLERGS